MHPTPSTRPGLALAVLLLAPAVLLALAPSAAAFHVGPILAVDLGVPENYLALDNAGIPPCSAGTSPFCYDLLPPAGVNAASLLHRDVLYVGWTEGANPADLATLAGQLPAITAFVQTGGAIVALSEYAIGNYAWVPGGSFSVSAQHADDVVLTAAGAAHPSHAGQSSASLSGWGNSRHNYFTAYPAFYDVLSRTSSGWPVSLAGHYGEGCILVTGQDPDWHSFYVGTAAATDLIRTSVYWASHCQCHDECEKEMSVRGERDPVDHFPDTPFDVDLLRPVRDERYPHFFGTTTVDIEDCDCRVVDWSINWTTAIDTFPYGDAIGPVVTQVDADTFTISAADADTYFITFTVYLRCPDGTIETLTQSWYQRN